MQHQLLEVIEIAAPTFEKAAAPTVERAAPIVDGAASMIASTPPMVENAAIVDSAGAVPSR